MYICMYGGTSRRLLCTRVVLIFQRCVGILYIGGTARHVYLLERFCMYVHTYENRSPFRSQSRRTTCAYTCLSIGRAHVYVCMYVCTYTVYTTVPPSVQPTRPQQLSQHVAPSLPCLRIQMSVPLTADREDGSDVACTLLTESVCLSVRTLPCWLDGGKWCLFEEI